jgi:squalene-associated FAD-dependent desaturase
VASPHLPVAVIGGGWAGCAAALALAAAGHRVLLHESAPTLGGRARRVVRDGLPLDNGQHLLLGAYVAARRAIAQAHVGPPPCSLAPLALEPLSPRQGNALRFRPRRLPPPFGLAAGLLFAHGLTLAERIAALRWFARLRRGGFRCPPHATVSTLLADLPAAVGERLWAPLCVAALNTAPERASAQVFANVLRAAFDGDAQAGERLVPAADLGSLFPDAAARRLAAGGHAVHTGAAARVTRIGAAGPTIATRDAEAPVRAALVAVGPHQLAGAFGPAVRDADAGIAAAVADAGRLAWEPIVTVYLGYAGAVALPAAMVRLDDRPGQWAFDRPDILAHAAAGHPPLASLVAVVISAHGEHLRSDQRALAAAVDAQLRRHAGALPPLAWTQVIAERRATYACTPDARRPPAGRLAEGVYLAGDYTDREFPATLEAAVRSGERAAAALVRDLAA